MPQGLNSDADSHSDGKNTESLAVELFSNGVKTGIINDGLQCTEKSHVETQSVIDILRKFSLRDDEISTSHHTTMDLGNDCPDDVLIIIFKHFDLFTRFRASLTCRRWNRLLTDPRTRMADVAVVNVFERNIWEQNLSATRAKDRLKSIMLDEPARLANLVDHISQCNSLKIWFNNPNFVYRVLEVLRQHGMRAGCLDLYPYDRQIPLNDVLTIFPDLEALSLRPHGSDFFWTGMPLCAFPDFHRLEALVLDSLTLDPALLLPPSVTQLEWSHRDDAAFVGFLDKLEHCPNVKYLLIGHVQMEEAVFRRFLRIVRTVLRRLVIVVFKFVRFPTIDFDTALTAEDRMSEVPRPSLIVMKFDLCYGDMLHTTSEFVRMCGPSLQIVNINIILEENQLTSLYSLVPVLKKRNVLLQLGVLQRSRRKADTPPLQQVQNADDPAVDAQAQNQEEEGRASASRPPSELRDVLCKMDMSFVDSFTLLQTVLSGGAYSKLLELKFIECKFLNDNLLDVIASTCVCLKRLHLHTCVYVSERGLTSFLKFWDDRKSKQLSIIWKGGGGGASDDWPNGMFSMASFYLRILTERAVLLRGKRVRRIQKRLPPDGEGERLVIWDAENKEKVLIVQDYSENDLHWVMGFVVG